MLFVEGVDMVWMMGMFRLGTYGLNHDRTNPNLLKGYRQLLDDFSEQGKPPACPENPLQVSSLTLCSLLSPFLCSLSPSALFCSTALGTPYRRDR